MGWRRRLRGAEVGDENVRDALVKTASAGLAAGKFTDRTYLAALYVEQVRTNELLEQLLEQRPARSSTWDSL